MEHAWYVPLRMIARRKVPTYWRLTYGAEFWWRPDEAAFLPHGFAKQPFSYSEVASVTVYGKACAGQLEEWSCELEKLRVELIEARGIRVVTQTGVKPWPSSPPTEALELTVAAEQRQ